MSYNAWPKYILKSTSSVVEKSNYNHNSRESYRNYKSHVIYKHINAYYASNAINIIQ